MIFVFGSNLAGVHRAGAASCARKYEGAIWGQGIGLQGTSYAIPTKDQNIETLPLEKIQEYVNEFLEFARTQINLQFFVTRIGCGLAGYKEHQIAPMFDDAPENCILPETWRAIL